MRTPRRTRPMSGKRATPPTGRTMRSWLFPTVYKYIAETGNTGFLDEVIPYANQDKGTVYDHLKRALDFSLKHLGPHGMPAGLHADWNDCLRLGLTGSPPLWPSSSTTPLPSCGSLPLARRTSSIWTGWSGSRGSSGPCSTTCAGTETVTSGALPKPASHRASQRP